MQLAYLVAAENTENADALLDLAAGDCALDREVIVDGLHDGRGEPAVAVEHLHRGQVLEGEVAGRLEAALVALDHEHRVLLLVDLVRGLLDAVQALGDYRRNRALDLHRLEHVVPHVLYSLLVQFLWGHKGKIIVIFRRSNHDRLYDELVQVHDRPATAETRLAWTSGSVGSACRWWSAVASRTPSWPPRFVASSCSCSSFVFQPIERDKFRISLSSDYARVFLF